MKEIPTWPCRTTQLQIDMGIYAEAPMVRDGVRLSYWQAHPEHWRYRDMENVICDQLVFRANHMCEACNKRQWAWEKEQYRIRRLKALAAKAAEPAPQPPQRGYR